MAKKICEKLEDLADLALGPLSPAQLSRFDATLIQLTRHLQTALKDKGLLP
jgi:hypothetical protein